MIHNKENLINWTSPRRKCSALHKCMWYRLAETTSIYKPRIWQRPRSRIYKNSQSSTVTIQTLQLGNQQKITKRHCTKRTQRSETHGKTFHVFGRSGCEHRKLSELCVHDCRSVQNSGEGWRGGRGGGPLRFAGGNADSHSHARALLVFCIFL